MEFIKKESLIKRGDKILLGVSGGADSVYLLRILCALRTQMDLTVAAVHVNHQIRPEAGRDQAFVEALCNREGIPCKVFVENVIRHSKNRKISLEEAGREIRYEIFQRMRKEWKFDKIAVAHHKDDQAETFLFRIARGTGIEGAGAMKPVDQKLIRPLLCLRKDEIKKELRRMEQDWVEDSTNEDNAYARNMIRNQVIPDFEQINLRTVDHIASLTEDLRELMEYLQPEIGSRYASVVTKEEGVLYIAWKELKQESLWMQKQIIKRALEETAGRRKDIEKRHVLDVLALYGKDSGSRISLPYDMKAEKNYQEITLWKGTKSEKKRISGTLIQEPMLDFVNILEKDCIKIIDYDKIEKGIQLRCRKPGDFFVFDKEGRKKSLNRYFIDEKIPRDMRDQIPLVADGSHIVWIVGRRVSSHYQISEGTSHYLKLEFKRGKGDELSWRGLES